MKIKVLEKKNLFRLKDWGISRQRYWGCPIPMIYLEDGTVVPVDKSELPIELPDDIDLKSQGNPLDTHPNWKITKQKSTGKKHTEKLILWIHLLTHLGIFEILFSKSQSFTI